MAHSNGKTPGTALETARVQNINLRIRAELHEAMKAVRLRRYQIQGSDVKLCLIFEEAVRMYLAAPEQQELLAQLEDWKQTQRARPKRAGRKSSERLAS